MRRKRYDRQRQEARDGQGRDSGEGADPVLHPHGCTLRIAATVRKGRML